MEKKTNEDMWLLMSYHFGDANAKLAVDEKREIERERERRKTVFSSRVSHVDHCRSDYVMGIFN